MEVIGMGDVLEKLEQFDIDVGTMNKVAELAAFTFGELKKLYPDVPDELLSIIVEYKIMDIGIRFQYETFIKFETLRENNKV